MTKKVFAKLALCTLVLATVVGCSSAFRNIEEPYMRPGALDANIPNSETAYSRRSFIFQNRYRVSHEWLRFGCHHGSLQAGPQVFGVPTDLYSGPIYEKDGITWQESLGSDVDYNLNRYVRSVIRHQPIYVDDKGSPTSQPFRYEDQEQGLQAMCFQAWVGTSHTLILRLHKRNLADWKVQWSQYNPSGKWSQKQIKGISWAVLENDESELQPKGTGGWFKSYVTPIADTGYSISFQLGASQQSLQNPQAHAAMQEMFHHLIESVKIEPLTPAIEAEQAQLKARAEDIQRQECIESAKRGKPGVWCKTYGIQ